MTLPLRDDARLWRSPLLPGAELLTAQYYAQEFAPHWHEGYAIPVIQAGAQRYRYRGALCVAGAGSIAAINPGEIHTGERATDNGWAYRVFYPSVDWMQALASDIAGHRVDVPWLPDAPIDDADVATPLAQAHRLLETGLDPLAAEHSLVRAFALLLSRHARSRVQPRPMHPDALRVARMKDHLVADLAEPVPLALLRQGLTVTEVAAAQGFADQSHFTRHFKRAFGVPPGGGLEPPVAKYSKPFGALTPMPWT